MNLPRIGTRPLCATALYAVMLLACFGCQQDIPETTTAFNDCRYQAPEAIFSPADPSISQHRFNLSDGKGVEEAVIDNDVSLMLIQTGCDQIVQEFQFQWEGSFLGEADAFWIRQAAERFYQLGNLGASYLTFRSVAKAIEVRAQDIRTNRPVELQPGVELSIEAHPTSSEAILLVTLTEK